MPPLRSCRLPRALPIYGESIPRCVPIRRDGLRFFQIYHPNYAMSYGYPRERYREELLALKALIR